MPFKSRFKSPKRLGSGRKYHIISGVQAPDKNFKQRSKGQSFGGGIILFDDGCSIVDVFLLIVTKRYLVAKGNFNLYPSNVFKEKSTQYQGGYR